MVTKAQIKESVIKEGKIRIESSTTVGGAVAFILDYGHVRCIGWATEVERNITKIDDLVDYLYDNRARIIKE